MDGRDDVRTVANLTTWVLVIAGPFLLIAAFVTADTIKSALLVCFKSGEVHQFSCVLDHLTSRLGLQDFLVKFVAGLWRSYLPAAAVMLALKFVSQIVIRWSFRRF